MGHVFFSIIFAVSVRSALTAFFDGPEPALAFYGVYHRNPWNQAIHFVGVPMILWSLLVLAAHVPLLTMGNSTKQSSLLVDSLGGWWWGLPQYPPTWATLIVLLYVAFYLRIDVVGALLYLPILLFMYKTAVEWTARCVVQQDDTGTNNNSSKTTRRLVQWAIVVHVLGWYLQIHPGHIILEGAQPAGVANLGAALTTAPLFAFYEGVWFLGFRKELQQRVLDLVAVYTQELCEEGSTMRVCETLQH
jgi:2-hydroxy fatty acid dioxygenase